MFFHKALDGGIHIGRHALGMADVLVLVVVAGLEAVVVVVAGLDAVVGIFAAGLEAAGAFGAADGVCATTREAVANRVVSNKVVGLMVRRFC